MNIKIGQTVSYKDYSRRKEMTGKVVCISLVQDCLYKEYIGKIALDVGKDEYGITAKVWIDDVIRVGD